MSSQAAQAYDEGAVAFFIENLCQEADLIYRFGYALTLSTVGAAELVNETYARIVSEIPSLMEEDSQKLRLFLIRNAWDVYQGWSKEFRPTLAPIHELLAEATIEVRSILILIDGIGLTPKEVAQVIRMDEVEVRCNLAEGRRRMIKFNT
ncbi:MAG: hypothetical protein ACOH5I_16600 [Oligoflexus sp.]